MKIIGKESEIKLLQRQRWRAREQHSQMTLVTGPRISGKTALVTDTLSKLDIKKNEKGEIVQTDAFLYFDIKGVAEPVLLKTFIRQTNFRLETFVPSTVLTFRLLLEFILGISEIRPFSLVIDNFDEFQRRSPSFYGYLADLWRKRRRHTHLNLVLCSSSPNVSRAVFEDENAPLLGCADMKIHLGPMSSDEMKHALSGVNPDWKKEDLLALYMVTGGCPGLVADALDAGAFTKDAVFDHFLSPESSFSRYMKWQMTEILGHNSDIYMSILHVMASGMRTQPEIEDALGGMVVGGHLAKLENEYFLVTKSRPVLADRGSRNIVRYCISEQCVEFWLRYLEPYKEELVAGDPGVVRDVVEKDFAVYSRQVLRRYFLQMLSRENNLPIVGGDWKSMVTRKAGPKGRQDIFADKYRLFAGRMSGTPAASAESVKGSSGPAIDILALDPMRMKAIAVDVEYDAESFRKEPFLDRISELMKGPLSGYSIDSRLFTLSDM